MFGFCCAANLSPKNQGEMSLCNPIYRKLGGKKKQTKTQKTEMRTEQTNPTNQSIIYGIGLSNVQETSRHIRTNSELVHSVCLRALPHNQRSHVTTKKPRPNIEQSCARSLQKQMEYSRLQDKYISVLERTNQYLSKALESKEKPTDQPKSLSKNHHKRKMSTELQELKNRLNSIDLTGISKLAKLKIKTESDDPLSTENKQNKNCFKTLRSRIQ